MLPVHQLAALEAAKQSSIVFPICSEKENPLIPPSQLLPRRRKIIGGVGDDLYRPVGECNDQCHLVAEYHKGLSLLAAETSNDRCRLLAEPILHSEINRNHSNCDKTTMSHFNVKEVIPCTVEVTMQPWKESSLWLPTTPAKAWKQSRHPIEDHSNQLIHCLLYRKEVLFLQYQPPR